MAGCETWHNATRHRQSDFSTRTRGLGTPSCFASVGKSKPEPLPQERQKATECWALEKKQHSSRSHFNARSTACCVPSPFPRRGSLHSLAVSWPGGAERGTTGAARRPGWPCPERGLSALPSQAPVLETLLSADSMGGQLHAVCSTRSSQTGLDPHRKSYLCVFIYIS